MNSERETTMTLQNIKAITVVGAGTMGPGIALSFARHGYRVRMCDQKPEALSAASSMVRTSVETLVRHGLEDSAKITEIEGRISFESSLEKASEAADFVIECVSENREVKRSLFHCLDNLCPPETIFASNTSYLNVFCLVPENRLPHTIITHWFAPPHILPLVEVVREAVTSEETAMVTLELLKAIGKTPVLMNRFVPGFAINRIQRIIGREVFFLLDNGYISPEHLDLAVKASIAPRMMLLGLVQRYDFTGLDLSANNLKNDEFIEPPLDNQPKALFDRVKQGHCGVKSGKGFYDYGDRNPASVYAELNDALVKILKDSSFCLEEVIGQTKK
jgi:3-hydroxybutyryl-CoA dehydrogenase